MQHVCASRAPPGVQQKDLCIIPASNYELDPFRQECVFLDYDYWCIYVYICKYCSRYSRGLY